MCTGNSSSSTSGLNRLINRRPDLEASTTAWQDNKRDKDSCFGESSTNVTFRTKFGIYLNILRAKNLQDFVYKHKSEKDFPLSSKLNLSEFLKKMSAFDVPVDSDFSSDTEVLASHSCIIINQKGEFSFELSQITGDCLNILWSPANGFIGWCVTYKGQSSKLAICQDGKQLYISIEKDERKEQKEQCEEAHALMGTGDLSGATKNFETAEDGLTLLQIPIKPKHPKPVMWNGDQQSFLHTLFSEHNEFDGVLGYSSQAYHSLPHVLQGDPCQQTSHSSPYVLKGDFYSDRDDVVRGGAYTENGSHHGFGGSQENWHSELNNAVQGGIFTGYDGEVDPTDHPAVASQRVEDVDVSPNSISEFLARVQPGSEMQPSPPEIGQIDRDPLPVRVTKFTMLFDQSNSLREDHILAHLERGVIEACGHENIHTSNRTSEFTGETQKHPNPEQARLIAKERKFAFSKAIIEIMHAMNEPTESTESAIQEIVGTYNTTNKDYKITDEELQLIRDITDEELQLIRDITDEELQLIRDTAKDDEIVSRSVKKFMQLSPLANMLQEKIDMTDDNCCKTYSESPSSSSGEVMSSQSSGTNSDNLKLPSGKVITSQEDAEEYINEWISGGIVASASAKCGILFDTPDTPVMILGDKTKSVFDEFSIKKWVNINDSHPYTREIVMEADIVRMNRYREFLFQNNKNGKSALKDFKVLYKHFKFSKQD
jgi:hypothetical protein